jgi:DNA-binding response OmpR family regulator
MRLRALVRRASGHAAARIACGRLVFDAQIGHFELDGLPLRLTAFEWRVLSALMLRKEAVVDRSDLLERVYEYDADGDSNSLEVIVGRLRRKIGAEMIETVRGRGYRLTSGA